MKAATKTKHRTGADHKIATARCESDEQQVALQGNITPSATNQVGGDRTPFQTEIVGILFMTTGYGTTKVRYLGLQEF